MKNWIIKLLFIVSFLGCSTRIEFSDSKLELSNGNTITFSAIEKEIVEGERVLVVELVNEDGALKEDTVEKEVYEVWKTVEQKANEAGIEESVIRASYFIGKGEKSGERKYEEFLFNGEKIENGTWKIIKVN